MGKARAASIAGMACLAGLMPATVAANDTFGGAVAGPAPKVGRATLSPAGRLGRRLRRHARSQR